MHQILYLKSSLLAHNSTSSALGDEFVDRLKAKEPGSRVTTIDLARTPLPHLDSDEFTSWSVPDDARTPAQRTLAARSDALIDQLLHHDTLVLAVPMYNMGIPSTLKAWIDRVTRAGRTFRYTADGPEGLVRNVRAYLIFARGGMYFGTAQDTQTAYLQGILGLMGITDVETIFAEGLNMGDTARDSSLANARDVIQSLLLLAPMELSHAS